VKFVDLKINDKEECPNSNNPQAIELNPILIDDGEDE
jgi:hypothetical protein